MRKERRCLSEESSGDANEKAVSLPAGERAAALIHRHDVDLTIVRLVPAGLPECEETLQARPRAVSTMLLKWTPGRCAHREEEEAEAEAEEEQQQGQGQGAGTGGRGAAAVEQEEQEQEQQQQQQQR